MVEIYSDILISIRVKLCPISQYSPIIQANLSKSKTTLSGNDSGFIVCYPTQYVAQSISKLLWVSLD